MLGVMPGSMDFNKAAAPAICGEENEVPLANTKPSGLLLAPRMVSPGAIRLGFRMSCTGGKLGPLELKPLSRSATLSM